MGVTQLYSRCQVGHCNGCVQFEFNDILFYTNDTKRDRLLTMFINSFHILL